MSNRSTRQRVTATLKELTKAGDERTAKKALALLDDWGKLLRKATMDAELLRHLIQEIAAIILGK